LEEPPPHVKFIFATTEIRKVPITVLSRCQRFDLRRIDAAMIKADLRRIAGLEGIDAENEALTMVARAAEGSMRDAQSIFDQAIAHGAGTVTAEAVRSMLGLADRTRIIDLFEHLMKGEVTSALDEFRAQYDTGADPATVLTDLAEFNHLVTRLRFVPSAAEDATLNEDERRRGLEFAQSLSVRVLSRTWQMLLKGIPEVQESNRPVSAGEMVLIRIAHAADLPTLDEALRSLDRQGGNGDSTQRAPAAPRAPTASAPPTGGGNGPTNAIAQGRMPTLPGGGQAMRIVETEPVPSPVAPPAEPAVEAPTVPLRTLADIAALADTHRDMAFKVLLKRCVRPVRIENGRIDISLTPDTPKTLISDLNANLQKWTGRRWVVSVSREEGGPTLAEQEASRRETALTDARNDPTVAAILARFPGAKIIDVRIPNAPEQETEAGEDLPIEPAADDEEQ
ncbi:MAG TPA: DNA polymerase III subunit gamma/tau, partial [Mesorhizobium sp.]|nr:DNA polymerase III subunit gamma/tau [Mesorhizobium sp.]